MDESRRLTDGPNPGSYPPSRTRLLIDALLLSGFCCSPLAVSSCKERTKSTVGQVSSQTRRLVPHIHPRAARNNPPQPQTPPNPRSSPITRCICETRPFLLEQTQSCASRRHSLIYLPRHLSLQPLQRPLHDYAGTPLRHTTSSMPHSPPVNPPFEPLNT